MVAPLSTQNPLNFIDIKKYFKDPGYFAKDHSIRLSGNELKLHGAFSLSGRGETKAAARLVKQEAGKTAIAMAISHQYQAHPGLGARVMQNLADKSGGSFKLTPAKLDEVQREIDKELASAKSTNMPRTEAPDATQMKVAAEVTSFLTTAKDPPMMRADGQPTGVSRAFWADLDRANFSIAGHNGASTALINKSTLTPSTKHDDCMNAVAQLRDLCGGNAELLMGVSKLANQNIGAIIQMALVGNPASPLRLPNDTPGSFSSSIDRGSSHFAFSSSGNGDIKISIAFSNPKCDSFISINSEHTELDPTGSRYDSFLEISVGPDLKPRVSAPLAFSFDVRLAIKS
jgi:hypothetical protein